MAAGDDKKKRDVKTINSISSTEFSLLVHVCISIETIEQAVPVYPYDIQFYVTNKISVNWILCAFVLFTTSGLLHSVRRSSHCSKKRFFSATFECLIMLRILYRADKGKRIKTFSRRLPGSQVRANANGRFLRYRHQR